MSVPSCVCNFAPKTKCSVSIVVPGMKFGLGSGTSPDEHRRFA